MLKEQVQSEEDLASKEEVDLFRQALDNIKPVMEVRSRRIGGAAYLRNNNVTINNNTGSRNSARRCAGFYFASSGSCRHLAGS